MRLFTDVIFLVKRFVNYWNGFVLLCGRRPDIFKRIHGEK